MIRLEIMQQTSICQISFQLSAHLFSHTINPSSRLRAVYETQTKASSTNSALQLCLRSGSIIEACDLEFHLCD